MPGPPRERLWCVRSRPVLRSVPPLLRLEAAFSARGGAVPVTPHRFLGSSDSRAHVCKAPRCRVEQRIPRRFGREGERACSCAGGSGRAGRDVGEFLGRGESPPLLPVRGVLDELRAVGPLGRVVADLLRQGGSVHRPERFGGGGVDLGVGEAGQATEVVQVVVREDDVPNVLLAETEPFHLARSCLLGAQHRSDDVAEQPESPARVRDVLQAEAGADKEPVPTGRTWQSRGAVGRCLVPQLRWCTSTGAVLPGGRAPARVARRGPPEPQAP